MRTVIAVAATLLLSYVVASSLAADAPSPASQPASLSGDTELYLSIMEMTGKIDDLKKLKPADLEKLGNAGQRKGLKPFLEGAQPISELRTSLDVHSVTRCKIGTSMPVVLTDSASAPSQRQGGVRITYQEVGTVAEITPTQGAPAESVRLQLKITVGVPTLAMMGKFGKTTYEKTADVVPGKVAIALLDDQPIAVGVKDLGRLRFARLTLGPRRTSRFSHPKAIAQSPKQAATSNTRGELDCIQLSASVEKLAGLDLPSITADAPSVADLLKRLSAVGEAFQSSAGLFSFDSAVGAAITYGASLPTVTDVNISSRHQVTPSISYKQVGSVLRTDGMTWSDRGHNPKATTHIMLENSGIAISSVEVSPGVKLPAFSQFKIDQSQEFRSGVPEYFIIRGPAGPGTTEISATLLIVRLVLTAP